MKSNIEPANELTPTGVNGVNVAESNDKRNDSPPISWKGRIKSVFTFFTVEPFLLCYILPIAISAVTVNKFNTEKACRVDLNYTEEICAKAINGETDDNITELAQSQALKMITDMQSWQYPLQSSFPALVILFVGAWSDRTGNRKTLMLIPIVGEIISSLGLIFATYFFLEWPLWATALIEALPSALSGGQTIALMGSYSYLADVSSIESRTFRIGVVAVIVTLGFPVGTSISGILTQSVGYYGVFGVGFTLYVIGFIYTMLRIHDVNVVETEGSFLKKVIEFFNPKNIWDTVSIFFRNRGRRLLQIILVICAHIVILGPVIGEASILYQYTLYKFQMDVIEFSLFSTYTLLMGSIGTAVAITLFSKYLKMDDTFLGIIATGCKTISSFVYGWAPTKNWFYAGPVFDFFGNSGVTAIRSLGTKVVEPEDVAKMCALIGFAETIIPMVYGPIYTQVFSNTFEDYAGVVYFLGAIMTIPAFVIFIVLYKLHKKQQRDIVRNPAEKEMHAHDNDITSL